MARTTARKARMMARTTKTKTQAQTKRTRTRTTRTRTTRTRTTRTQRGPCRAHGGTTSANDKDGEDEGPAKGYNGGTCQRKHRMGPQAQAPRRGCECKPHREDEGGRDCKRQRDHEHRDRDRHEHMSTCKGTTISTRTRMRVSTTQMQRGPPSTQGDYRRRQRGRRGSRRGRECQPHREDKGDRTASASASTRGDYQRRQRGQRGWRPSKEVQQRDLPVRAQDRTVSARTSMGL
jgi:hypothetical protein